MGEYGALGGAVRAEQDALRAEEGALVALEADVGRAKKTVDAIGAEVRDSRALLDALEAGMLCARDDQLEEEVYGWGRFCKLLAPAVAAFVALLFALRYLLL